MSTKAATEQPRRLLRRDARREAIIDGATRAFARSGFAATSLDDIAGAAAISRVLIYRHFDSKHDLYQAALDRINTRIRVALSPDGDRYDESSVDRLVAVAASDPDGFRLFFLHAAREPEFREHADRLREGMRSVASKSLAPVLADKKLLRWASLLVATTTIEAIIAWLDAGQPNREHVAAVIRAVNAAAVAAIRSTSGTPA